MSRAWRWWGVIALLGCGEPHARSVGAVAGQCSDCHAAQADAFAGSAHAGAATSARFDALRRDEAAAGACDTCHAPDVGTDDGLSCETCHAAWGRSAPRDGALIHDLSGPVRGPAAGGPAPHDVGDNGFVGDDALCRTCHERSDARRFAEEAPTHAPAGLPELGRCVDCHLAGHGFARRGGGP